MGRFEDAAGIDTEPFDTERLDEIYVRPYAIEALMPDAFAVLMFRYFELFDRRYGTNIVGEITIDQLIGYGRDEETDNMIWYQESDKLLMGAMENAGWEIGLINTEYVVTYLDNADKSCEDEDIFRKEYKTLLDEICKDSFLKDALTRESDTMLEAMQEMENGDLIIIWNPELNAYMQFREKHPDVVEAVCKAEDQWIVKLEEDVWEPYMAFYRQKKEVMDGLAYCKVLIGCSYDSYVAFGTVNPNWICTAVKLNKMLQLANEKLDCFKAGQKNEEAA